VAEVVLSVLAHPDDAEFLCAGAMLRLAREQAWDLHFATMTPGDCGSAELSAADIARVRRAEGAHAAALAGGTFHCLEERDLLLVYGERPLERVTRLLREVQPRIVLTHSPADYMLDHEVTSTLARAAAFAAAVPNFLADRAMPPPLPKIPHLYYCDPIEGKDLVGQEVPPHFIIDISSVIEEKSGLLAAHASQRDWLYKHHGMDHYVHSMRTWSAHRGKQIGVAFGEGFRQHLGHSYPQDNLLGRLLASRGRQPPDSGKTSESGV
jgi:LmbE family N-acetylglucosaminyl deacetylase